MVERVAEVYWESHVLSEFWVCLWLAWEDEPSPPPPLTYLHESLSANLSQEVSLKSSHLWLALVKMAYVQIYKDFAYQKLWSKWQALYFYIYWFDVVLKLILVPSLTYFEFMKVDGRKTFLWV